MPVTDVSDTAYCLCIVFQSFSSTIDQQTIIIESLHTRDRRLTITLLLFIFYYFFIFLQSYRINQYDSFTLAFWAWQRYNMYIIRYRCVTGGLEFSPTSRRVWRDQHGYRRLQPTGYTDQCEHIRMKGRTLNRSV